MHTEPKTVACCHSTSVPAIGSPGSGATVFRRDSTGVSRLMHPTPRKATVNGVHSKRRVVAQRQRRDLKRPGPRSLRTWLRARVTMPRVEKWVSREWFSARSPLRLVPLCVGHHHQPIARMPALHRGGHPHDRRNRRAWSSRRSSSAPRAGPRAVATTATTRGHRRPGPHGRRARRSPRTRRPLPGSASEPPSSRWSRGSRCVDGDSSLCRPMAEGGQGRFVGGDRRWIDRPIEGQRARATRRPAGPEISHHLGHGGGDGGRGHLRPRDRRCMHRTDGGRTGRASLSTRPARLRCPASKSLTPGGGPQTSWRRLCCLANHADHYRPASTAA
jgi:hypothetical protein